MTDRGQRTEEEEELAILVVGYIFWLSSTIHSAQTRRQNISPSVHHFFFTETGSPLSIFTGFFKIIGGDGEGLEGGGGEGGDGS